MYTFCIDLDGTLKTESDFNCSGFNNVIIVKTSRTYRMLKRKGVDDFLSAAKERGVVYMTTAAGTTYGEKVAEGLGIRQYFDDIIGADRMVRGQWPQFKGDIIWIDNDREGLNLKINRLPYKVRYAVMDTWIIDTFEGVEDSTMKELCEEIKKLP